MMYISFVHEYLLEEMQGENARDKALKKLEQDIKDIRDGISYVNKDVESYNRLLKKQALHLFEVKALRTYRSGMGTDCIFTSPRKNRKIGTSFQG